MDRLMVFVDGTNLLRQLSKYLDIDYSAMKPTPTMIWLASDLVNRRIKHLDGKTQTIRRHWFASFQGGDDDKLNYMELLRKYSLEPHLYKNKEGRQEKGVDIGLATEILVNAFHQNYEYCYLIAGDKDYLGLIKEVKRYGAIVYGGFFSKGLSTDLRLEFDAFHLLEDETEKFNALIEKYRPIIFDEVNAS